MLVCLGIYVMYIRECVCMCSNGVCMSVFVVLIECLCVCVVKAI